MCSSPAEGGQRCYGQASTTLVAAEANHANVTAGEPPHIDLGDQIARDDAAHMRWRAQELHAAYTLEDARARYASTPQGETDLTNRMDTLAATAKHHIKHNHPASRAARIERRAYAQALTDGRRLRERAANIAAEVKAGTLAGADAIALTQFPPTNILEYREDRIASTEAAANTLQATETAAAVAAAVAAAAAAAAARATLAGMFERARLRLTNTTPNPARAA